MKSRHVIRVGVVSVLAAGLAFAWPVPGRSDTVEKIPVANAQATIGAIVPRAGSIPVTVAFGNAAADLSGTRTRGRANDVELGLLGTIITGGACGRETIPPDALPTQIGAASPEGPASASRTRLAVPKGPNSNASTFAIEAKATPDTGSGDAEGVKVNVPGVVTVNGGRSSARTTNKNGVREAVAAADFAIVQVGPVRLENVRTEVWNRTGAKTEHGTRFTIGAIVIGGVRTEPPASASPDTVLKPLNQLLKPLGLAINAPKAEYIGQTQYLRPFEIVVGKSLISENAVGPLLGALQPARDRLNELATKVCGATSVLTVADIGLALAAGSGTLALQFGSVEATSGEVEAHNPFGTFTPRPAAATPVVGGSVTQAPVVTPSIAPSVRRIAGSSGGTSDALVVRSGRAALAIGLAVLLIALLAGRDWLVMRANSRNLMEGN